MKRKIVSICLISMFLLTSFTVLSGVGISKEIISISSGDGDCDIAAGDITITDSGGRNIGISYSYKDTQANPGSWEQSFLIVFYFNDKTTPFLSTMARYSFSDKPGYKSGYFTQNVPNSVGETVTVKMEVNPFGYSETIDEDWDETHRNNIRESNSLSISTPKTRSKAVNLPLLKVLEKTDMPLISLIIELLSAI